jgi:hypothetical protein
MGEAEGETEAQDHLRLWAQTNCSRTTRTLGESHGAAEDGSVGELGNLIQKPELVISARTDGLAFANCRTRGLSGML